MVFNPSIPRPSDYLNDSQGELLSNNGFLNASFSRNHIALNQPINNGKHTFIEMPVSANIPNPSPSLIPLEGTLYTKTNNGSQLYYTPDDSGHQYQLTRTVFGSFGSFAAAAGWTFFPGNLLFQWAQSVINLNGTTVINFPTNFTTACFSVVVTPIRNASNVDIVYVVSQSTNNFTVRNTSTSAVTTCNWMAIGN